eukprot:TRINITY_DN7176_c0_g1_i1.p1 TRINITY_DN7176_c0_g1~~TRINITY_DN7176_c0_g1_i1.p1  ORF type:complete len:306 (-),score=66.85 TRINITY_DN7176_c0_g1_i1:200-1069(-)
MKAAAEERGVLEAELAALRERFALLDSRLLVSEQEVVAVQTNLAAVLEEKADAVAEVCSCVKLLKEAEAAKDAALIEIDVKEAELKSAIDRREKEMAAHQSTEQSMRVLAEDLRCKTRGLTELKQQLSNQAASWAEEKSNWNTIHREAVASLETSKARVAALEQEVAQLQASRQEAIRSRDDALNDAKHAKQQLDIQQAKTRQVYTGMKSLNDKMAVSPAEKLARADQIPPRCPLGPLPMNADLDLQRNSPLKPIKPYNLRSRPKPESDNESGNEAFKRSRLIMDEFRK